MRLFLRWLPFRDVLDVQPIRWLVLSRLCADLYFYSTTIVRFQQARGLDFTAMFLMESILSAAIWLADVPTSLWADRFGYRRMILLGRGCSLLGLLCFLFAHSFWLFAFSNVLAGFAIACSSGCESALLYASLPTSQREQHGGSAFTLLRLTTTVGFFLGLLCGSFIGAISPTLAVAMSLPPMLFSLFTAWRIHESPKAVADSTLAKPARPATFKETIGIALVTIRHQPRLAGLRIFSSAAFAVINAIFWYNQPYFTHAGLPIALFGPAMALAMACQFLALFRLQSVQKHLGICLLLWLSCCLPAIAYILLALTAQPMVCILLVACIVSFSAWQAPLVEYQLNKSIPDQSRATTLSGLGLIGSLIAITLNPWIGALGDHGLTITGFGLGLALLFISLLIPLILPPGQPAKTV